MHSPAREDGPNNEEYDLFGDNEHEPPHFDEEERNNNNDDDEEEEPVSRFEASTPKKPRAALALAEDDPEGSNEDERTRRKKKGEEASNDDKSSLNAGSRSEENKDEDDSDSESNDSESNDSDSNSSETSSFIVYPKLRELAPELGGVRKTRGQRPVGRAASLADNSNLFNINESDSDDSAVFETLDSQTSDTDYVNTKRNKNAVEDEKDDDKEGEEGSSSKAKNDESDGDENNDDEENDDDDDDGKKTWKPGGRIGQNTTRGKKRAPTKAKAKKKSSYTRDTDGQAGRTNRTREETARGSKRWAAGSSNDDDEESIDEDKYETGKRRPMMVNRGRRKGRSSHVDEDNGESSQIDQGDSELEAPPRGTRRGSMKKMVYSTSSPVIKKKMHDSQPRASSNSRIRSQRKKNGDDSAHDDIDDYSEHDKDLGLRGLGNEEAEASPFDDELLASPGSKPQEMHMEMLDEKSRYRGHGEKRERKSAPRDKLFLPREAAKPSTNGIIGIDNRTPCSGIEQGNVLFPSPLTPSSYRGKGRWREESQDDDEVTSEFYEHDFLFPTEDMTMAQFEGDDSAGGGQSSEEEWKQKEWEAMCEYEKRQRDEKNPPRFLKRGKGVQSSRQLGNQAEKKTLFLAPSYPSDSNNNNNIYGGTNHRTGFPSHEKRTDRPVEESKSESASALSKEESEGAQRGRGRVTTRRRTAAQQGHPPGSGRKAKLGSGPMKKPDTMPVRTRAANERPNLDLGNKRGGRRRNDVSEQPRVRRGGSSSKQEAFGKQGRNRRGTVLSKKNPSSRDQHHSRLSIFADEHPLFSGDEHDEDEDDEDVYPLMPPTHKSRTSTSVDNARKNDQDFKKRGAARQGFKTARGGDASPASASSSASSLPLISSSRTRRDSNRTRRRLEVAREKDEEGGNEAYPIGRRREREKRASSYDISEDERPRAGHSTCTPDDDMRRGGGRGRLSARLMNAERERKGGRMNRFGSQQKRSDPSEEEQSHSEDSRFCMRRRKKRGLKEASEEEEEGRRKDSSSEKEEEEEEESSSEKGPKIMSLYPKARRQCVAPADDGREEYGKEESPRYGRAMKRRSVNRRRGGDGQGQTNIREALGAVSRKRNSSRPAPAPSSRGGAMKKRKREAEEAGSIDEDSEFYDESPVKQRGTTKRARALFLCGTDPRRFNQKRIPLDDDEEEDSSPVEDQRRGKRGSVPMQSHRKKRRRKETHEDVEEDEDKYANDFGPSQRARRHERRREELEREWNGSAATGRGRKKSSSVENENEEFLSDDELLMRRAGGTTRGRARGRQQPVRRAHRGDERKRSSMSSSEDEEPLARGRNNNPTRSRRKRTAVSDEDEGSVRNRQSLRAHKKHGIGRRIQAAVEGSAKNGRDRENTSLSDDEAPEPRTRGVNRPRAGLRAGRGRHAQASPLSEDDDDEAEKKPHLLGRRGRQTRAGTRRNQEPFSEEDDEHAHGRTEKLPNRNGRRERLQRNRNKAKKTPSSEDEEEDKKPHIVAASARALRNRRLAEGKDMSSPAEEAEGSDDEKAREEESSLETRADEEEEKFKPRRSARILQRRDTRPKACDTKTQTLSQKKPRRRAQKMEEEEKRAGESPLAEVEVKEEGSMEDALMKTGDESESMKSRDGEGSEGSDDSRSKEESTEESQGSDEDENSSKSEGSDKGEKREGSSTRPRPRFKLNSRKRRRAHAQGVSDEEQAARLEAALQLEKDTKLARKQEQEKNAELERFLQHDAGVNPLRERRKDRHMQARLQGLKTWRTRATTVVGRDGNASSYPKGGGGTVQVNTSSTTTTTTTTNSSTKVPAEQRAVVSVFSEIEFVNMAATALFWKPPVRRAVRIKKCVITGEPAKYRDPLTKQPFSSVEAFRSLRAEAEARKDDAVE